jgi:2-iminoacetate synthase ThiH
VETPAERIGHLIKLRELQAETPGDAESDCGLSEYRERSDEAGNDPLLRHSAIARPTPAAKAAFNCMIPLSFAPEQSELGHLPGNTGLTDLKTLAIARLMLDNVAARQGVLDHAGGRALAAGAELGVRRPGRAPSSGTTSPTGPATPAGRRTRRCTCRT